MLSSEDDFPVMDEINFTENGITKLLKNLNPCKSPGPDNLGPRVLKEMADDIAPILLLIFRRSLASGEVPADWRTANVAPVFKKGQKYLAENYRPISLTSVCCKIMEHILASNIMSHGEHNSILYPLQHGFRKGRSCETQLIEFMDDLTSNLEEGHQTDILIMDFAKAFDKVDHSLLTHKLHHYGIRGNVNTWIKNWLKDRKQSVVVDGEKSEPVSVDSGVSRGSVLGPGLFLYYIKDLPARLRSRVRLFADDTIAYLVIILQKDAESLQEDLEELAIWENKWHMEFHANKCVVLTAVGNKAPIHADYKLHDQILTRVKSAKYLGVTLTDNMKWDQHINNICDKANRTIAFLRRNLSIGATSVKERAYFTLVRPLVEYASTVWDPHTQKSTKKVEMVQRRAARYAKNRHRNKSSVTDMLSTMNWRSLEDRRRDARLCMLYKVDRNLVAIKKDKRLIPPKRRTRHSQGRAYQTLSCRTEGRKNSFFPRTVCDWNALPPDITEAESLAAFKAQVTQLIY